MSQRAISDLTLKRLQSAAARLNSLAGDLAYINSAGLDAETLFRLSDVLSEASLQLEFAQEAIAAAISELQPHIEELEV